MSYTSLLTQTATYWAPAGNDGYGGQTFAAPVQLLVRWQDSNQLVTNIDGEEVISQATIYSDQQLAHNGFLFLGTSVAANPDSVQGSQKIISLSFSQTPTGSIIVYKSII